MTPELPPAYEPGSGDPGIAELIRTAGERYAREDARTVRPVEAPPQSRTGGEVVELIRADTVTPEPVRWLWPGWLARGKLHVLAGAPGTGKTTIALCWAACISAGRALPSGHRPPRGAVLIWSGEDDPADTIVPRLLAMGADLPRVHIVRGVIDADGRRPFDPAHDVAALSTAAERVGNVALIIVDPLVSAVASDSHKNAEVRRSLAPLVDLGARLGAAVLGITHYSKGTQGSDPLERVTGSLAFGALARIVFGTVRQQSDDDAAPKLYTLARAKSNIGPDGSGYSYAMEAAETTPGIATSRIVWGEALDGTARDLLAEAELDADGADAASWLRDLLTGGPMPAKQVFAEARAAGYAKRTIQHARKRIGAQTVKEGMSGGWLWRLAEGATPSPKDAEDAEGANPKSVAPSRLRVAPSSVAETNQPAAGIQSGPVDMTPDPDHPKAWRADV